MPVKTPHPPARSTRSSVISSARSSLGERERKPGGDGSEGFAGRIESIHLAPAARAPMTAVSAVELRAGHGIVGDRYGRGAGTFSDWPKDHELTLVEAEVIESVAVEWGVHLAPGETRRNLQTRGIRLNGLVGHYFRIGGVLCVGTRLCEPCAHLEIVTGLGGLARMMAGRGGLRARVLEDGTVRVGDEVTVLAMEALEIK